ncbi:MAG: hypothetical protein IT442_04945 [Phycisphaeraceae bacterium]|nr:hypothetical protein [Phycisphaeraceae bacterium]
MPIVLSYNDVSALGKLAYAAGYAPANAQASLERSRLNTQMLAQMDQQDLAEQQLLAQERQAVQDRQQKSALANLNATLEREAMAAQERRFNTQIAAQQEDRQSQQTFTLARDEAQRQAELQQVEAQKKAAVEVATSKATAQYGVPTTTPGGLPTKQQVEAEVQSYGGLIPFPASSGSVVGAARGQEDLAKIAQGISSLPTGQVQNLLKAQPKSPWAPYLQAILRGRGQAQTAPGSVGGSSVPSAGGAASAGGQALSQGTGYGDVRAKLKGLSNDELQRLAQDPQAFAELMAQ